MVSGILGLVFMNFAHLERFGEGKYSFILDHINMSTGYSHITWWKDSFDLLFLNVIDSILLVFMIILPCVIILLSIFGITGAFAANLKFFKKFHNGFRRATSILLTVYALFTAISFVCILIFAIGNSGTSHSVTHNYVPGIGAYLLMCFAVPECFAVIITDQIVMRKDAVKIAEYTCSRCGNVMSANDKFCSSCGGQLTRVGFCPSCGKKLEDGDRFCSECGATVNKTNS